MGLLKMSKIQKDTLYMASMGVATIGILGMWLFSGAGMWISILPATFGTIFMVKGCV